MYLGNRLTANQFIPNPDRTVTVHITDDDGRAFWMTVRFEDTELEPLSALALKVYRRHYR